MEGKKHSLCLSVAMVLVTMLILSGCGDKGESTGNGTSTTGGSTDTKVTTSNVGTGGNTGTSTPTPVADIEDYENYLVAQSESPFNFCVKYSSDYSYEWSDDCGITIYTDSKGYIPYVLVWRSFDTDHSAQEIHEKEISEYKDEYGDRLLSNSGIKTRQYGDKTLTYVEYKYLIDTTEITMMRLIDESPRTGYVMYTAKYITGQDDDTLEALALAIESFRDNKKYYDNEGSPDNDLEIIPSFAQTMEYRTYDDGWITMQLPSDWRVFVNSFNDSASAYILHAYDPMNPDIQIFTGIQTMWFVSEAAYTKLVNYPLQGKQFKGLPYMISGEDPVAETYKNFNVFKDSNYGNYMKFTSMNDWTEIERFGTTPLGGELIRASYKNDEGTEIEGVFSGKWSGSLKLYGYQYPGAIYSPMFMTAPAEEFNEWLEVLNYCLSTVEYSQDYIDQYYAEESATMKAFQANTQIYNEMSDMITSSWYERQTTYDTISAKQSDATLGYERVYNVDTLEVYRAEIGFSDSYSGSQYKPITEDMYSAPIEGYIYK